MTNSEEKPIFTHKNSPSKHQDIQVDQLDVDNEHVDEVWGKGWIVLVSSASNVGETISIKLIPFCSREESIQRHCGNANRRNRKKSRKKLAGRKWKNFIRKMSGYCNKRKTQRTGFHYDPYSYALNFDNGADKEGDDLFQDFSSRFAAPFADERQ